MKSLKKNFIYTAIYQILAILIPLITTPYLSRILGAEELGKYSYAYSIAYYFVLFIKLGLDNYGNRSIAYVRQDKAKMSRFFCEIYSLQLINAVIFILLYVVYCAFFSNNNILSYILFGYVLSSMFDITWLFYGIEEFKITVSRNIIIKIISTMCIFIFVKSRNNISEYTFIISAGCLISQLAVWPFLRNRISFTKVNLRDIFRHLKPNLVLFIPVIAISLYNIMDKIMLGNMSTNTELGYYDSSEKILQIPIALITALGTVMMPRMSNLRANNEKKQVTSIIENSIRIAMFLSCGMSFGIMAVSKTFVPWYYGMDFKPCIVLFLVLLPSCIFLAFANVIRTQYLIPYEKDTVYICGVFSGAVVNLVVNYLLIPKFQAMGAAVGTLLAEVMVCVVQAYLVKDKLQMTSYIKDAFEFIIPGIIMFVFVYNIDFREFNSIFNLFLQVAMGILIYVIIVFLISSDFREFIKKGVNSH